MLARVAACLSSGGLPPSFALVQSLVRELRTWRSQALLHSEPRSLNRSLGNLAIVTSPHSLAVRPDTKLGRSKEVLDLPMPPVCLSGSVTNNNPSNHGFSPHCWSPPTLWANAFYVSLRGSSTDLSQVLRVRAITDSDWTHLESCFIEWMNAQSLAMARAREGEKYKRPGNKSSRSRKTNLYSAWPPLWLRKLPLPVVVAPSANGAADVLVALPHFPALLQIGTCNAEWQSAVACRTGSTIWTDGLAPREWLVNNSNLS